MNTMKRSKLYYYLGVAGALVVPALSVAAVNIPNVFSAGDTVSSSKMNENFTTLRDAINTLESQVEDLQAELDEARTAAGYITLSNGDHLPYYRKVLNGTRSGSTTTLAHGISGNPATERRFLGCDVVVNYNSGGPRQTQNMNSTSGASTPTYCDMDDTNLIIAWYNSGALDFQVSLFYTNDPIE